MAVNRLEKLVGFTLQYGSSQIGYNLEGTDYDLSRKEVESLHCWAKHLNVNSRKDFRAILMNRHKNLITVKTDLLSLFERYFLYVKSAQVMKVEQIMFSIESLLSAFNCVDLTFTAPGNPSPADFKQERNLLEMFRELFELGESDRTDLDYRLTELLSDETVQQFIFPIYSDVHASYGCCERTSSGFRIAICNGDIGLEHFHYKDVNLNDRLDIGHCIASMDLSEATTVLSTSAQHYNDENVFEKVGKCFNWNDRKLDSALLFAGTHADFLGLEVSMRRQVVDNCVLFNLNHAIRFAMRSYPDVNEATLNPQELRRNQRVVEYGLRSLLQERHKMPQDYPYRKSFDYTVDQLQGWAQAIRVEQQKQTVPSC